MTYIEMMRLVTSLGWKFHAYDGVWVHDSLGTTHSPVEALMRTKSVVEKALEFCVA